MTTWRAWSAAEVAFFAGGSRRREGQVTLQVGDRFFCRHDRSIVFDPEQPKGSIQVGLPVYVQDDGRVGVWSSDVEVGRRMVGFLESVAPDGFAKVIVANRQEVVPVRWEVAEFSGHSPGWRWSDVRWRMVANMVFLALGVGVVSWAASWWFTHGGGWSVDLVGMLALFVAIWGVMIAACLEQLVKS